VVKRASDFMLINPRGLDKTVYDPAGIAEQVLGITANGTQGSNIASATTTDIGAATGSYVHITGTTTIAGLGTITAGVERSVVFDGILALTHNATSLILPTGANITTTADDTAIFRSEGSGNWRCISYERADGTSLTAAGGVSWVEKTGAYTAVAGNGVMVGTDTAAITITLPASPATGDTVIICDQDGNAGTNNITVGRNALNIMGAAANMTLDVDNELSAINLILAQATKGLENNRIRRKHNGKFIKLQVIN